jgi:hypothetical protein
MNCQLFPSFEVAKQALHQAEEALEGSNLGDGNII